MNKQTNKIDWKKEKQKNRKKEIKRRTREIEIEIREIERVKCKQCVQNLHETKKSFNILCHQRFSSSLGE